MRVAAAMSMVTPSKTAPGSKLDSGCTASPQKSREIVDSIAESVHNRPFADAGLVENLAKSTGWELGESIVPAPIPKGSLASLFLYRHGKYGVRLELLQCGAEPLAG